VPGIAVAPPYSAVEPVTEILHGVPITDPYRWLESRTLREPPVDSRAKRNTHAFIWTTCRDARRSASAFVNSSLWRLTIPFKKRGIANFFRKRLPEQEQPSIYLREGADERIACCSTPPQLGTGNYTAVKTVARIARRPALAL